MARCRLPPARWLALLLLLGSVFPVGAALRVEVADTGLTPAQRQLTQRLLEDVLGRLPHPFKQRFDLPLQLRWRDDLPAQVHGRARGHELGLQRALLERIDTAETADPHAWRAAQAALIHELAHALDRLPAGRWSAQPRFLDLAGWQRKPLKMGRGRNAFALRSPDAYERHSPAEFFAVNLEHVLLDPDYACRRPALQAWYAAALGLEPVTDGACAGSLPFVRAGEEEGTGTLLELDPQRVYEVDYLLAEGNDVLMSRWGHSMLRLVVCAPGRPRGPACRMDLQYHLVLSFRAFVGDVQISSWRGLTGSYPSRLFVLPLNRVVDEYTRVELRSLSSTPLQLQRDEVAALLRQAARLHWSYDGRYYFISNNCAVETWKLLHEGVPRFAATPLSSITPTGLLKKLRRAGAAVPAPAGDRAEAVRRGYYFESAAPHYALVFARLQANTPLPVTSVEAWLALPALQRRRWIDTAPGSDGEHVAALLMLEQAAWRRNELRARDRLKRVLLSARADSSATPRFRQLMEQAGVLLAPGTLPVAGYGLPQARELAPLREQVEQRVAVAAAEAAALRQALQELLPATERAENETTRATLEVLHQRLRVLYGDAASSERGGEPR
ncbi:hypothetical protein ARC78_01345 [Stenotrophomonas pictorum JCM 9942]|uniref:Uncharacterized protein n=2 Tax=Stenotrophomonas pictorum TaxID=86184 RepID=A0A0R0AD68_9GAMM|nr:DUF4105 domain-containing protein [Stenotrophomonas pictorum]KRG39393.1 hypothetical protein ARC78_01345 [Stenotrophomonas pictorum JCM 9942]